MDQREFTRITMVVLTGRREVGVAVGWLKWEKKERGVLFFLLSTSREIAFLCSLSKINLTLPLFSSAS